MAGSTARQIIVQIGANNADLERGLKRARTDIERFQAGLNNVANQMAVIGGGFAAVAAGAVHSAMEWAAAVNDLEDKTNMSAEAASKWLYVGQVVGLQASDVADAMTKMARSVSLAGQQQAAAAESGRIATDVYTRYGIAITDASGRLLSQEQIFANVAKRHREMANGLEKTNMELEIFGRSGAKLNDMLNFTEAQFAELGDEAKRLGLVLDGETSQAWEDFEQRVNRVKAAGQGLAVQVGNALLPELEALANRATEVAKDFNQLTDEQKQTIVRSLELGSAIGGLGLAFRAVSFALSPLIGLVKTAWSWLGAMAAAASSAAVAVAGVVAALAAMGYRAYDAFSTFEAGGVEDLLDRYGDDETKAAARAMRIEQTGDFEDKDSGWAYVVQDQAAYNAAHAKPEPSAQPAAGSDFGAEAIPAGGGGGGGGGIDTAAREAERLAEIAETVRERMAAATDQGARLADAFGRAGADLDRAFSTGGARVIADIEAEYAERRRTNEAYLNEFAAATKDAQRIRAEAERTGNAEVIAAAQAMLEERQALEAEAAETIAARRLQIDEALQAELLDRATQARIAEAEMQAAYDEGDMARYQSASEQRLALLTDEIAQKQEMLQQYYDWRREAEVSHQSLMMNAMNTFKDGFSKAFADAIVYSKNFRQALVDLAKQIVATYIQQRVQAKISSLFADGMKAKQAATTAANNAIITTSALKAAYAQSLATSGANIIAGEAAFAPVPGRMAGLTAFANGGVVTKPTAALIGEVPHKKEGVFPLTDETFSRFAEGIAAQGGAGPVLNLQLSALDGESVRNWLETGGGDFIRQYLFDSVREFATAAGVW